MLNKENAGGTLSKNKQGKQRIMTAPTILIDAYSQIFRAYYAVHELNNSRGEPTNAVFVLARMLLKLEKEHPSGTGALCFDSGKVRFRLALEPEYKANRPEMPEALRVQIPAIRDLSAAFGWPLLQEPEYEADDLIAAFARHIGGTVLIVSSDKDLAQLVDDRVKMLVPSPKNGFEERDAAGVMAKFNVPPEQIVDYLALIGDASDNIPGVPGIGPKTAARLLNTFGSAGNWLDNPGRIGDAKLRDKLAGKLDVVRKNRTLIALKSILPERFNPPESCLRRTPPNWEKIREICEKMELKSVLKELPVHASFPERHCDEKDDLFLFDAPSVSGEPKQLPEMEQGELF